MKFCDSCLWWEFMYDGAMDKFGTCTNPDVPEKLRVTDVEDLDEPTLFTAATFGCIYHQSKEVTKAVTPINVNKNR